MGSIRIDNHDNHNTQTVKDPAPKNRFQDLLSFWQKQENPAAEKPPENFKASAEVPVPDKNTEYLRELVKNAVQGTGTEETQLLVKGNHFLSQNERNAIFSALDQYPNPSAERLRKRIEKGDGYFGIAAAGEGSSTGIQSLLMNGPDHYISELKKFKPLVAEDKSMDLEAFNEEVGKLIDQKSGLAVRTMAKAITSYDLSVLQHLRQAQQVFPIRKKEGGRRTFSDFNRLSDFVSLSILSASSPAVAKNRIEFWIKVMKRLETIKPLHAPRESRNRQGNMHSFLAVYSALASRQVERLKTVWESVDPALAQYKEGFSEIHLPRNQMKYRDSWMIPLYSLINYMADCHNRCSDVDQRIKEYTKLSNEYSELSSHARKFEMPTYRTALKMPVIPQDMEEKGDHFDNLSDKILRMSRIEYGSGVFGLFRRALGL
jgi:hypothetical protein